MSSPGSSSLSLHQSKPVLACPYCGGKRVTKNGIRKNKYGTVQLFFCTHCRKTFTPLVTKHKSFPLRVIIEALSQYNRFHSLSAAAAIASRKFGVRVHRQTLTNWLRDLKGFLPILRLRPEMLERFPRSAFLERQLFHRQVYAFKYHRAKAALLLESSPRHAAFRPLREYLEAVPKDTPHELFRDERSRASTHKPKFDIDGVEITPKENAAIKNAKFVLQAVATNKLRHEVVQEFMLVNDSATVAVEVPIILTANDVRHYKDSLGFQIPFTLDAADVITGHIDIVQIRNGMIHILDYKPDAKKIKPIEQLTIYALALSRQIGLRLLNFKCAWFDDEHYYEFYPLNVVHKRGGLRRLA